MPGTPISHLIPFHPGRRYQTQEGEASMKSRQPNLSAKRGHHHVTRRRFIGTTAAGGAALLTGGLASLFQGSASARTDFPFVEASIMQLQAAMAAGQLSARELVQGYLNRIQQLNPTLHAVIE